MKKKAGNSRNSKSIEYGTYVLYSSLLYSCWCSCPFLFWEPLCRHSIHLFYKTNCFQSVVSVREWFMFKQSLYGLCFRHSFTVYICELLIVQFSNMDLGKFSIL